MSEDRSSGPRLPMPTDRHSVLTGFLYHKVLTRNILITWKGILLLGFIVPFTCRDAKNCVLHLGGHQVCVWSAGSGVAAVIRQKMIPGSKLALHLNHQHC